MSDRFECLIDDNYRRRSGRLPDTATDRDSRFDCLVEDSPRYRKQVGTNLQNLDPENRFSKLVLDSRDSRKKDIPPPTPPKINRKPPECMMIKESVNQRIKRLRDSGELPISPYTPNRPRSNTTQLPIRNTVKTYEQEFPSLNKNDVISKSAPCSPQMPEITNRLVIQELPLPVPKYVALSIKNGKYCQEDVYSMEDNDYVPEPQVLVIRKPVYNKWSDLLNKRASRPDVYVNSLRDALDDLEKFENS